MDLSRALVLGRELPGFETGELFSRRNLHEFGSIILELETINSEMPGLTGAAHVGNVGNSAQAKIVGAFSRLEAWLREGHTLIAITSKPFWFSYGYTGMAPSSFTLGKIPLFKDLVFGTTEGQRIEFCGPKTVTDILEGQVAKLKYQTVLGGKDIAPLFQVSKSKGGQQQILGGYRSVGDGLLIIAPELKEDSDDVETYEYYFTLVETSERLKIKGIGAPRWLGSYRLPKEDESLNEIARIKNDISTLETQIEKRSEEIRSIEPLKRLFFATGEGFVDAVAGALRELGLTVVKGPHPRADLLAFDGKRIAAIECKGVDGSAREINLRQAEKWVADVRTALASSADDRKSDSDLDRYAECLKELGISLDAGQDIECEGVMIIGTFRQTMLSERGNDFPDPVARPINRSKICALTGLQLMEMLMSARDNPKTKESIFEKLFSTNGVLAPTRLWPEFLIEGSAKADD